VGHTGTQEGVGNAVESARSTAAGGSAARRKNCQLQALQAELSHRDGVHQTWRVRPRFAFTFQQ